MAVAACAGAGVEFMVAGVAAFAIISVLVGKAMLVRFNGYIVAIVIGFRVFVGIPHAAGIKKCVALGQKIYNVSIRLLNVKLGEFAVGQLGVTLIDDLHRSADRRAVAQHLQRAVLFGAAQRECSLRFYLHAVHHNQRSQHGDVAHHGASSGAFQRQRTLDRDIAIEFAAVEVDGE